MIEHLQQLVNDNSAVVMVSQLSELHSFALMHCFYTCQIIPYVACLVSDRFEEQVTFQYGFAGSNSSENRDGIDNIDHIDNMGSIYNNNIFKVFG